MPEIVKSDYQNLAVTFTEDGWFNATTVADRFGKKPIEWLRLPETDRYLDALCRKYKVGKSHFVKTRRGGNTRLPGNAGTWFHPKLGVDLSVSFTDEALDDFHNHAKQRDLNTGESGSSNTGEQRANHARADGTLTPKQLSELSGYTNPSAIERY